MTKFAQWVNDKRWAANMRRVRRFQRKLGFGEREIFFAELRPYVDRLEASRIAYPDAMMFIKIEDVLRAIEAVDNHKFIRMRHG